MNKRMITGIIVWIFDLVGYISSSNDLPNLLRTGRMSPPDYNPAFNDGIVLWTILALVGFLFFLSGYRDRH